jgi:Phage integrase, N-terminal SAM-like domain/Arm DNA-binding domain
VRGFVRKRGNTYTWYFDVPDPVTGKRRQYSKGGFRTKKECQHALNDALAALRTGTFVEPSQRTVAGFLVGEWLPAMRPPRVRPSTWLSYQRNIERHIVPALGHLSLQRLTPAQLTAFYRGLLETGHRKGSGGLAPKTVRNIHGALHAALRDAVRWGYVARNVAVAADLPKSMAPEMQVWSPGQLRAFLDYVRDDRLYAAWLLFATTGMRRGEVAGLRWVDVDLDAGRVSPRRPRVVVNHEVLVSEPKTAKGRRSIALDPATRLLYVTTGAGSSRTGSRSARAGRIQGWCSPGRTVGRCTQSGSPSGSSSIPAPPGYRRSACMTSATAMPPLRWRLGSRPRSSASASVTPTSPSPWTPIVTCCLAWTSRRPARWPSSSSANHAARRRPMTRR